MAQNTPTSFRVSEQGGKFLLIEHEQIYNVTYIPSVEVHKIGNCLMCKVNISRYEGRFQNPFLKDTAALTTKGLYVRANCTVV
jgi:hypothetical protein